MQEEIENIEEEIYEEYVEAEGEEEEVVEEEEYFYEDYMNTNTASFRCLKEIELSSSSLMRNALYHFPPLEDPGLDEIFDHFEPEIEPDDIGIEMYKKICKQFNIVPFSAVIKGLPTRILDLKYYGVSSKQLRAITEALRRNRHVEELILEDNFLTEEDCDYLNEMLLINGTIKQLNMKGCQIGPLGAVKLCDCVEATPIDDLDLSCNSIGDSGFNILGNSLCINQSIKKLNLSRNQLGDQSVEILAKFVESNEYVENLNLSWNELYTPLALKIFFNGMLLNRSIKSLNLSWNGLGLIKESAMPISKYLKENEIIQHLDLSNNRLFDESLRIVRGGIAGNTSLKSVNLEHNIIKPEEAYSIASLLTRVPQLERINLNCFVNKNFLWLKKRIEKQNKTVTIEGVLSNYKIHGPDAKKLLLDRIRYIGMKAKSKKKKVDFGLFQFTLPNESVTKDEFGKLLKKGKLKKIVKDKDLNTYFMKSFPDRNNVNCVDIKEKYMEYYPDTKPLPPKPKKSKKKKGGKKGKQPPVEEGEKVVTEGTVEGDAAQIVEGVPEEGKSQEQDATITQEGADKDKEKGEGNLEGSPEGETKEPTEGEIKEPTEGEIKEPAEGEVKEPTEGEVKEPTEGETKEQTEGEVKEPTEGEVKEPTEGEIKEPTEGETKEPTEGETKEPTEGDTKEPTEGETKEPTEVVEAA